MQYPMQYVIAEHTAARMMQKINMGHVLRLFYDLNITNYLLLVNRLFKIFFSFPVRAVPVPFQAVLRIQRPLASRVHA